MKSFSITRDQITRIIGAASADELSRQFNRHVDFVTIAGWTSSTKLQAGGIEMNEAELSACARRMSTLFGFDEEFLLNQPSETIADWAVALETGTRKNLTSFSFKGATRSNDNTLCTHPADLIFQDAAAAANLFYGRRRLLTFVAPHSLLGFVLSVLTPNLQQIESIDARGMSPEMLSSTLKFGDVMIATPTLWRYMMRENLEAPDNTMAVSFGGPMPYELSVEMRKAGFGVMRELYGSTETGLMGWRDATTEPFVLFDHWCHDKEKLIRKSPAGEDQNAQAMDMLDWDSERAFRLGGRRDGAVQIGAVNVFPDQVANALREHESIKDCRVLADRRGDGVNRLIAHITLESQFTANDRIAREIDAWCRLKLRQQERPRIYNFELP